ncbi:MAG: hypothetical protein ACJ77A_15515 [Actinomycetota bacterium]
MGDLDQPLDQARPHLEKWLGAALVEEKQLELDYEERTKALNDLRARIDSVERLLARGDDSGFAGAAPDPSGPTGPPPRTLHEAMALVLEESGNRGMKPDGLARTIAERDLYRMRDGRPANPHQIQARVTNYQDMFVRERGLIRLRDRKEER